MSLRLPHSFLVLALTVSLMSGCANASRQSQATLKSVYPVQFAGNEWRTAGFPFIPVTQTSATTGSWTVGPNTSQWTYDPESAKISYSHDHITYTGAVRVSDGYAWKIDWNNASVWQRPNSSFKNGSGPAEG